ncbi:MAG: hypothetical protein EBR06_04820 [Acidimicrobiia bacterium]|nr:hypothetical protein [Acidimicrobiia bacterium]
MTVEVGTTAIAVQTGSSAVAVSAVQAATDAPGSLVEQPLLSDQVIVVARSAMFLATGFGYAPNSPVQIWLDTPPVLLDTVITGADGSFRSVSALPKAAAAGQRTLRVLVFPQGSTPLPEVSAGADAVKEVAFGVVLLDDSAYAAVQNGALTLDEVSRAFVDGITGVKPLDVGHASGWIGLLMLLMLIAAYTGDAPLIASRRRSVAVVSAMFDEALSLRRLGRRRYALAAAAAALALVGLVGSDFVPVYPTTLGFAALMLIAAIDPLAGVAAGVVGFAAVLLGGGVTTSEELRAAIVMAVTYAGAPFFASAVARRIRRTAPTAVATSVGLLTYLVTAAAMTRVTGALLRAELEIDQSIVLLVAPAAIALAVRTVFDQQYEQSHRRELSLRRMPMTVGLVPAALAVLGFVLLSEVLIDDESLLALLLLGVIVALRQAKSTSRPQQTASPSRLRRGGGRTLGSRRPPTSRTR